MGWKENKQKHDEYVEFVTKVLTGYYQIVKEEDKVKEKVVQHLKRNYDWEYPKDYEMKLVSKKKNKYHFRVFPHDVIEYVDIKIIVDI